MGNWQKLNQFNVNTVRDFGSFHSLKEFLHLVFLKAFDNFSIKTNALSIF